MNTPNYRKVHIWKTDEGTWAYCFPSREMNVHSGYLSERDALKAAQNQKGFVNRTKTVTIADIDRGPPPGHREKRSQRPIKPSPVSPLQTDAQDHSTDRKSTTTDVPAIDPVCKIVHVELSLMPTLQKAVEAQMELVQDRLTMKTDLSRLNTEEADAVTLVRQQQLRRLQDLRQQLDG